MPVPRLARGTLSRQLTFRVTVLVAVISVILSALSVLSLHTILQAQLDQRLTDIARLMTRDVSARHDGGGPGQNRDLVRCDTFMFSDSTISWTCIRAAGTSGVALNAEQTAAFKNGASGRDPDTVRIPGLGAYRVMSVETPRGTAVVGLPADDVTKPTMAMVTAVTVLTLTAILLAYFAARTVVARSLRPLQRLANTANAVSSLELESGEVNVPVRVNAADTNPDSEVGQVGLAFNRMLDNVEGALTARQRSEMKVRQFVADASHELRNPLASIRGYAELTRRERDAVPANTAHALARIESESERMSSLVEDLLLLARLDSGPNLMVTPTGLNQIIANAVSDANAAGPDHVWTLSLPDEEVVGLCDPARFHQVVANLLANARTHTPAGTTVTVTLTTVGTLAVLTVADDGPGIPETIKDKVFERFTRADAARVRQESGSSTGLGLAIVAAVMRGLGGTATVESKPGAGSIFTLTLPRAPRA